MKTYYQILGVLDDAEEVVIRAAYKALSQKYHPDKWKGSKEEANARMVEINLAYETLVDPVRRSQYDETIDKNRYDEESDANEDELIRDLESKWSKVVEFLPALGETSKNLSMLSRPLEYVFKLTLLETKKFKDSEKIAQTLENGFLTKYFGNNKAIRAFAKQLILDGNRKDAKLLNEAVALLGSEVDPNLIIRKIKAGAIGSDGKSRIQKLASDFLDIQSCTMAEEFMRWMGATIKELGFWGGNIEVEYNGMTLRFSRTEFVGFALREAREFMKQCEANDNR